MNECCKPFPNDRFILGFPTTMPGADSTLHCILHLLQRPGWGRHCRMLAPQILLVGSWSHGEIIHYWDDMGSRNSPKFSFFTYQTVQFWRDSFWAIPILAAQQGTGRLSPSTSTWKVWPTWAPPQTRSKLIILKCHFDGNLHVHIQIGTQSVPTYL